MLGVVVGVLAGLPAVAHAEPAAELASSPAQRCLSPVVDGRVKPVYPPKLYDLKLGATVEAEFEFAGPDRRPEVHIDGEPRDEFGEAIEEYARQLRVPCMNAGEGPVRLRQTFVFVPNDGRKVMWSTPADVANPGREEMTKCVVKPSPAGIRYPGRMARELRDGTVIARVRFSDPAAAPSFELLSNGGDSSFGEAVASYIEQLRMPCLTNGPVEENYCFEFRMEGGGNSTRRVLKDLPLSTFLAAVKPVNAGSVFFDTNTMACPFDVRLTFQQPFEPNKIEELEEDVPARHPLLDWLGQRQFDLDVKHSAELLNQQMIIHVPCVKIDL
jgi:hypothetical protein